MSLLLEALKKAEKAKEEAQRRVKGNAPAGPASLALQEDAPSSNAKPVLTRAELPDISAPLEILSDDIAPKTAARAAEPQSRFAGAAAAAREAPAREPAAQGERGTAKKVFEVKFREPNPRLPFYLVLGALGFFAIGTIGYFWYQLRPSASLVNLNPAPGAQREAAAPVPAPIPAPSVAPAPPVATAIPGLPSTRPAGSATPAIPRAAPPPPPPGPSVSAAAPVARQGLTLRAGSSSVAAAADPEPVSPRSAPQVDPKVQAAYTAYVSGDYESARAGYQEALRDNPANRDALLGIAALDVRSGRFEAAEGTYLRLLRADPRDAHAQAALITLRGARQDPLVTESRLKNLLATDPGAHVLNFALGNQLAQQGRWSEAQQEYFKAFASEPDNADFAYNLAVSLDHLRQPRLALEYYQRAVALAAKRSASFDAEAVRQRIAQLDGQ